MQFSVKVQDDRGVVERGVVLAARQGDELGNEVRIADKNNIIENGNTMAGQLTVASFPER